MAGQCDDDEGHTIQSHTSLSVVCTLFFSSSVAPVEDSVSDQVSSVSLEACRVSFGSFFHAVSDPGRPRAR